MKKIVLIISLIFLIFQLVVLATDIDIGSPAINRESFFGDGKTIIAKDNPANHDGKIYTIEIWASTNLTNVEIGIFEEVSANHFTTRDNVLIGTVTSGEKKSFDVEMNVETGDFLGIYYSDGYLERDESGYGGMWYVNGDQIPCTNQNATFLGGDTISVYGTGTTTAEEDNAIFFGTNF